MVSLGINDKGMALVTYTEGSQKHQTLAYGAENALRPLLARKQVDFSYDYSGGYTLYKDSWRRRSRSSGTISAPSGQPRPRRRR